MFHLPQLPYDFDALVPRLSSATLKMHYEGHHQAYVNRLNELLQYDKRFEGRSLMSIMSLSEGELFNCAAQAWNHTFYWHCMTPKCTTTPDSNFDLSLRAHFESLSGFCRQFVKEGGSLFGSGWLWLVLDKSGKLAMELTPNAGNPALQGKVPLLVCDLWEHSYYLDYQKNRSAYLEAFCESINWQFVSENFARRSIPDMTTLMGGNAPDSG